VPLALTRFAGIFNRQFDKFIVGILFGAAVFAEFSIGARELPLVNILPYSIASTMLPNFVSTYEAGPTRTEGARKAIQLWHTSMEKAMLVMLPVAGFVILEARPAIELLYGARYVDAALPFRVYASLLPLRITSYGTMLLAFGRPGLVLRVQAYGVVANIVASLILLPWLGMIGAPLSAVATTMFIIAYMLWRIEQVGHVGLRGIFPFRFYGKVMLAVLVALAPVLAFRALAPAWALQSAIVEIMASSVLFLGAYLALADRLHVLGPADRAFVARWLRLEPLRTTRRSGPSDERAAAIVAVPSDSRADDEDA
jgi:O-antigen/teichoic acid export membrane protein